MRDEGERKKQMGKHYQPVSLPSRD